MSPLGPLPEGWSIEPLSNITSKIGSGATPRGGEAVYLRSREEFAFIRSQNVHDYFFDANDIRFVSDEHANQLRSVHVQHADLLLNITGDGATFGRCCMVPAAILPAAVNQHVCIIRVNPSVCRPGYLLAYLCQPRIKEYIESFNAGGSRRAITKGHIESFLVALPPLPIQEAIERVVHAILEKISLNKLLNQALEEVASTVFQAWFIDFLPVRAKAAARVDGRDPMRAAMCALSGKTNAELDAMPQEQHTKLAETAALFPDELTSSDTEHLPLGWSINPIGSLLELKYGKALPSGLRHRGKIPVYGSGGIAGFHDAPMIEGPGIVVGRKGTVGSVYWVTEDFYPIDTVFYVKLIREFSQYWTFQQLCRLNIADLGADSAVPGVNRNAIYGQKIALPPQELALRYEELTRPMVKLIDQRHEESRTLAELRDTLLPRLLSGELRVGEAAELVEAAR